MPSTKLSVTLPGEGLAIALIELVRELSAGQSAAQKKKMWDWIIADIERWRVFWGVDNAEAAKSLRELLGLPEQKDG